MKQIYYADKSKMRVPFIGEDIIFDYVSLSEGGILKGAYCFIKKKSYPLKENQRFNKDNFIYVKDNSILMEQFVFKKVFYKVKVTDAYNIFFDKEISIQPLKEGELENKISLSCLESKRFKFVGFLDNH